MRRSSPRFVRGSAGISRSTWTFTGLTTIRDSLDCMRPNLSTNSPMAFQIGGHPSEFQLEQWKTGGADVSKTEDHHQMATHTKLGL